MSTLPATQLLARRESVVTLLTSPDLASIVDLVVWVEVDEADPSTGPVAMAASHLGRVRLHADGSHQVLDGLDPIATEDPMAFLPYDRECGSAGSGDSRQNSYPYAASRILSLFADPTRSPDVAVVHTPGHFFPEEGGHVGVHGSLDVIQSRAPFLLSGQGVAVPDSARGGMVDAHVRLVDVCPTLAAMAGVPDADLRDAAGDPLDGRVLTAYLSGEALDRPAVVGILWDGAHCGDLLHLAESGELPGVARLIDNGLALRGGAVAQFPSVTRTNHTSILTGLGPGRHGVLGNVFYDRATGERVVPNNAATWHRSSEWLRPASYFSWCTQVDDLGLEQMRALWGSLESAPTLTWWANVVTDAGHHAGGPRSDIACDSLRDSDSRLVAFLEHLDALGITDQVTFLLTADHGFERSDSTVTGSWRPALESLGIPFRDEGPGLIYLLADPAVIL